METRSSRPSRNGGGRGRVNAPSRELALAPLEAVHDRLARVHIERLPYAELIRRYDRPGALFYLDPPYWGCEDDYGEGVFEPADFERLRALLDGLKGRFILSINDTPEIRAIFGRFMFEPVGLNYRYNGVTPARELIITGP